MAEYQEGSIYVVPETGESWILTNGEWKPQMTFGPVEGALQAFNSGLLFEGADEAMAGLGALRGKGDYRDLQQQYERAQALYRQEHPYVSGIAQVAGATLPVVGAALASYFSGGTASPSLAPAAANLTRAGTMLAAGKEGARWGVPFGGLAAVGAASPEEMAGPVDQAITVGKGMATGGVTGFGVGAGTAAASTAAQALKQPAARLYEYVQGVVPGTPPPAGLRAPAQPVLGSAAERRALNAMEDANQDLGVVRQNVQAGRNAGVPTMIADVAGTPTRRLLRGNRVVDPRAGELIDSRLDDAALGQYDRVSAQVDRALPGPRIPRVQEAVDAEVNAIKARGAPAYAQLDERPVTDPATLELLQSVPAFREAHEALVTSLARAGKNVPRLFDDNGQLVRTPTVWDLNRIKQGVDDDLWDASGALRITQAAQRARPALGELGAANRRLVDAADAADAEYVAAHSPAVGAAPLSYAEARSIYGSANEFRQATAAGHGFLNQSPAQVTEHLRNLGQAGQEAYRRAALDSLQVALSKAADRSEKANVLNSIFGWGRGSKREALRVLVPNDRAFAEMEASFRAELHGVASRRFIQGGSQTADKEFEGLDALTFGHDVANAAAGNFTGLGRWLHLTTNPGAPARFELSDALTSMSGPRADEFLQALQALQRARGARGALQMPANAVVPGGSLLTPREFEDWLP